MATAPRTAETTTGAGFARRVLAGALGGIAGGLSSMGHLIYGGILGIVAVRVLRQRP